MITNKMKAYECSVCGYSTNARGNANKHLRTKIGCDIGKIIEHIEKLECEICNKTFNDEVLLKQHKDNCIKKKALVVNTYTDSKEIKECITILFSMLQQHEKKFEKLNEENIELKKRIDRLESKHRTESNNIKKGFIKYDVEDENYAYLEGECCITKYKKFIPNDFPELLSKCDKKNFDNNMLNSKLSVCILDKNGAEIECKATASAIYSLVDNKMYEYKKTLVVIKAFKCLDDFIFKIIKTGNCYCTKHFDEESGKPLEIKD
jgi:hypothetical protein